MKILKRSVSMVLVLCMILSLFTFTATAEPAASESQAAPVLTDAADEASGYSLDLRDYADQWAYGTTGGLGYYELDVVYCSDPVLPEVQHMKIYAPEEYMRENEDGTVELDPEGTVTSSNGMVYTAATAPMLYSNNSGGYSSCTTVSVNSGYIQEGYVHVSIGTRGKETQMPDGEYIGQFPNIVVDLKAGVRFLKANSDVVPGDPERIIARGASSGGALAAMLGATGNSPIFDEYLEEIGAADARDDIFIALSSCPITNLDSADAAFEWYQRANDEYYLFTTMAYDREGNPLEDFPVGRDYFHKLGDNVLGGVHEPQMVEVLYDWYVDYIQDMGFDLGDDGRTGTFYTGMADLYSEGLTSYIARYDELKTSSMPDTAEEYLASLDNVDDWIEWDPETGTATVLDFDEMMTNHVVRGKMSPSLDAYNYRSPENDVFMDAEGNRLHFSPVVLESLEILMNDEDGIYNWDEDALEYITLLYGDYERDVTEESAEMLAIMSPINYIVNEDWESTVAPYWRFRVGSTDGDHGLPAAWLIANGLWEYTDASVDIGISWEMGHGAAELTEQDLYDYIDVCMLESQEEPQTLSADEAIEGIHAIGFVDTDGAKLSAIAVEYNVDLTGADVSVDSYEITNYAIGLTPEIGSDSGVAVAAYVNNEPAISETGGTGYGNYVIIEVNTDYQLGSVASSYQLAMIAGVTQVDTVTAGAVTVTPGTQHVANYTGTGNSRSAQEGTFTILGTEVFDLYTKEDGTAFKAYNCYNEGDGLYYDIELPYALYVPEDYDDSKSYALVLHIHDAGFMGDDPMITLTEAQGPVNFASAEVQQLAKDQGLDGIIVLAPQIHDDIRSTRGGYQVSAAVPATWQLMDHITDTYSVDMNRIYGTGQSMGGMQVSAMASHRDNYFAAIMPIGSQWGSNFYTEDEQYNAEPYYAAEADGEIIWTVDADGNEVDYRNWYYMISDDNILCINCNDDAYSTGVWTELWYLYSDLAGVDIPKSIWNPLETSKDDQNALLRELVESDNDTGIYWAAFEGGNHMATWIYGHGLFGAYEWLLSQTRESEMEREKLDLDKPFELADEQSDDEGRLIAGGSYSLLTGKRGAGTADYNTTIYGRGGGSVTREPGWSIAVEDVVIDGLVLQSVAVGKELQLDAAITPANATQGLTWTSTNPNYATVEDGVVTGVAPGTVVITATAPRSGVSYSMRVKVTAF